MGHSNSTYVIAGILFIISLPIVLGSGIISIMQEIRHVREARIQGEHLVWYTQPKLLAGVGAVLFVLTVAAAAALYASITYKLLSTSLYWLVIVLVVLAALFGILYLTQVINGNNRSRNRSSPTQQTDQT